MMFASAFVIQKPFFWGVPEQRTLAAVLEVSPAALLMPPASSPFEAVELPGGVTGTASSPEEAAQLRRSWPRWDGLPPRLRQA